MGSFDLLVVDTGRIVGGSTWLLVSILCVIGSALGRKKDYRGTSLPARPIVDCLKEKSAPFIKVQQGEGVRRLLPLLLWP